MNIPPLAQLAFCMVMASLLAAFVPLATFETPNWLIAATVTAGALFLLPAVLSFIRHKTTVNPQSPELASTLATDGIYSVTRNPIVATKLKCPSFCKVEMSHLAVSEHGWAGRRPHISQP